MKDQKTVPNTADNVEGERIDESRRKAIAKLSKLGASGAVATVALLVSSRKSAASPL